MNFFEHVASCPGYTEPVERIEIPDESGADHANVTFNRSVLCVFRHATADHTYIQYFNLQHF